MPTTRLKKVEIDVLDGICGAERLWLRRGRFPFGVSAFCVVRRLD